MASVPLHATLQQEGMAVLMTLLSHPGFPTRGLVQAGGPAVVLSTVTLHREDRVLLATAFAVIQLLCQRGNGATSTASTHIDASISGAIAAAASSSNSEERRGTAGYPVPGSSSADRRELGARNRVVSSSASQGRTSGLFRWSGITGTHRGSNSSISTNIASSRGTSMSAPGNCSSSRGNNNYSGCGATSVRAGRHLIDEGGIEAIVRAVEAHRCDPLVVETGLVALSAVTMSDEWCRERVANCSRAKELISRVRHVHKGVPEVQEACQLVEQGMKGSRSRLIW
eukprot:jgi/Mesvir1/27148/Mv25926-RA.1